MSVTCYEAILGAATLRQVISAGFDPNPQVIKPRYNGSIGPSQIILDSAAPTSDLQTADLATLIGLSGFFNSGLNVTSGGITIPFIKRADGGNYSSGSSHNSVSASSGLVIPTAITAQHGSEQGVTCDLQVHYRSGDGRTIPYAQNNSQALASASFVAQYKLGPTLINGTQLTQCLGWSIQTGLSVRAKTFCGNEYPTQLLIEAEAIDPIMTINFEDFDALSTFGPLFANLSSAVCYARRIKDGGTTELDTSIVHPKFSFSEGLAVHGGLSAELQQDGNASIVLHGKSLTAALAAITL